MRLHSCAFGIGIPVRDRLRRGRCAGRLRVDAGDAAAAHGAATLDPAVAERLLALDPERVSGRDVAEVLARVPAPRIILLQGSFAPSPWTPFAEFLIAMGYPPDRIRHPRDGSYSSSSFTDSRQVAGTLAWYYETEGMRPLVIGHSQGGMLAIRVLHDLAGAFGDAIPVWNPVTDAAEPRTTIVDPLSGASRPVVGLRLPYAAALATGKLARVLLGQWDDAREAPRRSRTAPRNSPVSPSNGTSSRGCSRAPTRISPRDPRPCAT